MRFRPGSKEPIERFTFDNDAPTGQYMAMALDKSGKPVIAYYAGNIRGLKVYDETVGAPAR